uniref:Uncharacterized protein n=1 Tax=Noctiluca scintillans TaxID=2966 RepID=A0A7S1FC23_NOCSC|mmetsp:Transcript_48697/g.129132  ORF Transcript_48697/g.129132 Transcript_48697/m.129132 type:complete len:128 (+) Transcript_48697:305-688(+)
MSRENGDLRRLLNSSSQELGALRAQLDPRTPPESQVTSTILVQQQSLATAGPTRSWLEHAQREIPGQSMRIIFPGEAPLIDTVLEASPDMGGDSVVCPSKQEVQTLQEQLRTFMLENEDLRIQARRR